ncbi:MAG: glycosyltransferase family 4 protein [Acidobacteria bacterium]|nr:glycosyltransferase family 4 protein [Acidobacteriota bacterium]MCW5949116.1 glycosyltransferase family 4 protein [Pyrinomonadaceae bacterium]
MPGSEFPTVIRRRRLWVVSELYYPEETSTGYYLTRIAEGLADAADVRVICGQPNYSRRGIKAAKRERHNGVDIFRVAGTTLNKNVILFRLINMLTLGVTTFFKAIASFGRGDSILVVTTPPSMPFIIASAALLRGAGYTLLIHDNYPEILIAAGKANPRGLFVQILDRLNRWLYKHCERIIVVGRDMKLLLEAKTRGTPAPIHVIPNWAELETVEPRPRSQNRTLTELGLTENFVVMYAGNMGWPNDVETIIDGATELSSDTGIQFVFLGAGVKRKWIENEVDRRGLKNVTILDPRPREDQIDFLNACDLALVSLVDRMKGVSMPSRTYNILAAGKPILALTDPESELAMVIDEDAAGWHVAPGDVEGFTKALLTVRDDTEQRLSVGENARRAAVERYSLESAVEAYRQVLFGQRVE